MKFALFLGLGSVLFSTSTFSAQASCKDYCADIQERMSPNPQCKMTVIRASSSICGCKFDFVEGSAKETGGICSSYSRTSSGERVWRKVTSSWAESSCGSWSANWIPAACVDAPPTASKAVSATVSPADKPKVKEHDWDPYRQCYNVLRHPDTPKGPDHRNLNEVVRDKISVPIIVMPVRSGGAGAPPPGVYINTGDKQLRLPSQHQMASQCGGKTYYVLRRHHIKTGEVVKTEEFAIDWKTKDKSAAPAVQLNLPKNFKDNKECITEIEINEKDHLGTHQDQYEVQQMDNDDREVFRKLLLTTQLRAGVEKTCRTAKWCRALIKDEDFDWYQNCPANDAQPAQPALDAGKAAGATSAK